MRWGGPRALGVGAGKILAGLGGGLLSSFELWLTNSDLDTNSILLMARICWSNASRIAWNQKFLPGLLRPPVMCLMYEGFKRIAPDQDTGMDLNEPWITALELFNSGKK